MGAEPWCWTPDQVGKLTDAQLWDIYLKPAIERQKEQERARRGKRKRKPDPFGGIPSRAEFIAGGLHFGLTEEQAAAQYDEWAATEEGQRLIARRAEIEARMTAEAVAESEPEPAPAEEPH
jgi:hypothetical protein